MARSAPWAGAQYEGVGQWRTGWAHVRSGAERLELLAEEKELTRRNDELARKRRELPWVRVDKDYRFATEDGPAALAELFRGRSQLLVYRYMYPSCPSCASMADGFDGSVVHLENHDVAFTAICRAPLADLLALRERMGWRFRWASSAGSDFNYDFGISFTDEQLAAGAEYNFGALPPVADPTQFPHDLPGMSAFVLQDGAVHHTYSSYARGGDALWGMYQWFDRAPLGRNEGDHEFRLRDDY